MLEIELILQLVLQVFQSPWNMYCDLLYSVAHNKSEQHTYNTKVDSICGLPYTRSPSPMKQKLNNNTHKKRRKKKKMLFDNMCVITKYKACPTYKSCVG